MDQDPTTPTSQDLAPSDLEQVQLDRFDTFFGQEDVQTNAAEPTNQPADPPVDTPAPVAEPTDPPADPPKQDDPPADPPADLDDKKVEPKQDDPPADPPKQDDPAAEDDEKLKLDPNNEFDAETLDLIKSMASDPHVGIKFAALRNKLKQRNAELEAAKSETMASPEMQEVQARADRLSDVEVQLKEANERLALVDFQTTPEFQQAVVTPMNEIQSLASSIEKISEIPDGEIMKAISASDEATQNARIDHLKDNYDLSARNMSRLMTMADKILHINATEQSLRSSAQEKLNESNERAASEAAYLKEQEQAVYRQTLRETFQKYEGKVGAFVTPEGENKPEWDSAIKDSENFDFSDVELQALSAYALTTAPVLAMENRDLASKVSKLETLLSRHQSVKPDAPTDAPPAPSAQPTDSPKFDSEESMADAIGRRMAEAGL